jgi:(1->4)-alpha-D-glucan 1-alpha-D-glucosylmutase
MIPRATLRLQFHKGFTFTDAAAHIPYFRRLGISHVYASPITTARSGSPHGYDVVDPTTVNPELGGENTLRRFVAALRNAGLGLIVDIVPNHMAADGANAWWWDVLVHGPASRYAPYFDIDFDAQDDGVHRKVLLPVLGKPLRAALAAGEITLAREADGPVLRYFGHRFPVVGAINGEPLEGVLSRQSYRLAWWRSANDAINWRRFFDINELVALRQEHAPAFEDSHRLIFRLYAEGLIDGVRVDHVDGLSDPAAYCWALRQRLETLTAERPSDAPRGRAYLVVEKILLRDETLAVDWGCDGTSGYDAMNDLSALQHDARGERPLADLWHAVSGRPEFASEEQAARREIVARSFGAQLEACCRAFKARADIDGAEIARPALRRGLTELLAHFPVYRGYGTAHDRPFVTRAVAAAHATCLPQDRMVIDRLADWLEGSVRFWQLSAPVAAKAVEDTAFYRYGRLISRNDVGFDVERLSDDAPGFHARVLRRAKDFPHAMLATATHDHKRGEDTRARLAVVSECAPLWAELLPRWIRQCRDLSGGDAPSAADIAILLQTIVGAWPLDLAIADAKGRAAFAARLTQWQEKALREAKLHTDWVLPNAPYERAARDLITALIACNAAPALLAEIADFVARTAPAGAVNGLSQTLLKLTLPGVPDIYQGTELWDFSLVDPDNRRPVDFDARAAALTDQPIEALRAHWRDGRIKQALIARVLALRAAQPHVFAYGSYEPLEVRGACADKIVAFARRREDALAIVVVPRVASTLLREGEIIFDPAAWQDTMVCLPRPCALVDLLTGDHVTGDVLAMHSLFARLPIALKVVETLLGEST